MQDGANNNGSDPDGQGAFATYATAVAANGYEPIPVAGKVPIGKGWQKHRFHPLDIDLHPNANVGLLCRRNPFFDIDVLDGNDVVDLIEHLCKWFSESGRAPQRTGKAPKCGLLFRCATPFRKIQQSLHRGSERCKLEFLADGQQFVAFGVHPETGRKYDWNGHGSPLDVRWEDLPEITEAQAHEMVTSAVAFLLTRGWRTGEGVAAERQNEPKGAIRAGEGVAPMPALPGVPAAVLAALGALDPTPYEQWIRVGHILRAYEADGVDWDARAAWVAWSERAPNHQPGDDDRWETFRPHHVASPEYTLQKLAGTLPDPLAGFESVPPDWRVPPIEIGQVHVEHLPEFPYLVPGLIPMHVPTLFSAHGGSGKSYISLQLAVCAAAGVPFFGKPIEACKVLLYTCEEPEHEVKLRLRRILLHLMLTPEDLGGRLEIRNGYGSIGNILFTGNKDTGKRLTAPYVEFYQYVRAVRPKLVIVDNISEVYDGNEIDRAQVRQFIQSMNLICKLGCALVLVGHVDAATSVGKSAKGYSGSTAWHNSVRSRIFLHPGPAEGFTTFEPSKSNYGPVEPSMVLRFCKEDKVYVLHEVVERKRAPVEERAVQQVLAGLDALDRRGVIAGVAQSGPGAGVTLLTKELKLDRPVVAAAMVELVRRGWLDKGEVKTEQRKKRVRWEITPLGRASMVTEVEGGGVPAGWEEGAERGERAKGGIPPGIEDLLG